MYCKRCYKISFLYKYTVIERSFIIKIIIIFVEVFNKKGTLTDEEFITQNFLILSDDYMSL